MLPSMDATIIPFPARTAPACWSAPLHDLVDEIEVVLESGDAVAAIDLCRHALSQLDRSSSEIDDDEALDRLVERIDGVHRRACAIAVPDSVELARWLFGYDADSNLPPLQGAAERYAELLGDRGLTEYARLLDGRLDRRRSDIGRAIDDFRLRPTREALARARHPSAV